MSKRPSVPAASKTDTDESGRLSVVTTPEIRKRVKELAIRERRTLSAQCEVLIEQGLKVAEQAAA